VFSAASADAVTTALLGAIDPHRSTALRRSPWRKSLRPERARLVDGDVSVTLTAADNTGGTRRRSPANWQFDDVSGDSGRQRRRARG
jgi:hypothetical protein